MSHCACGCRPDFRRQFVDLGGLWRRLVGGGAECRPRQRRDSPSRTPPTGAGCPQRDRERHPRRRGTGHPELQGHRTCRGSARRPGIDGAQRRTDRAVDADGFRAAPAPGRRRVAAGARPTRPRSERRKRYRRCRSDCRRAPGEGRDERSTAPARTHRHVRRTRHLGQGRSRDRRRRAGNRRGPSPGRARGSAQPAGRAGPTPIRSGTRAPATGRHIPPLAH